MVKLIKPYRVLIACDETKYAHSLRGALVAQGKRKFEVVALTNSSIDAWQLINDKEPDAVIVDLQLEKGDGLDLLAKIREQADNLSVVPYTIAITKLTSNKIIDAAINLADYFHKKDEEFTIRFIVERLELIAKRFGKSIKTDMDKAFLELEKKQRNVVALHKAKLNTSLLCERIGHELDKCYMGHTGKGRVYLIEAISIVTTISDRENIKMGDIYNEMTTIFGVEVKSIESTMRRAIKKLYEADSKYMRAKYDSNTQVEIAKEKAPTSKGFIIEIANKIQPE